MTQASVPDGNDYDDERCHYYSEIKDEEDAEQRIGPATAPSSSRREKGPLNAGDYEVVDLDSDKGDEEITKLKGTPGRNPAADSPQSLSQTPRQDAADNTNNVIDDSDNEEDELIMHDNVVYQSSAALEHDKDRSVIGDDDAGQREGDVEHKDEDDSDDEDMVMVDNEVYQSCMDKKSDNEDTDVEER
nr:hypothetical protein BaRGS_004166 [Batillaria attramentaria]